MSDANCSRVPAGQENAARRRTTRLGLARGFVFALLLGGVVAFATPAASQPDPNPDPEKHCGEGAYFYGYGQCIYHCTEQKVPLLGDSIILCQYNNHLCDTPARDVGPIREGFYVGIPVINGNVEVVDCQRSDGRCMGPEDWHRHGLVVLYVCDWGAAP